MTKTIPTKEIEKGDEILGLNQVVSDVKINGKIIIVTFENGETMETSDNFVTTVVR